VGQCLRDKAAAEFAEVAGRVWLVVVVHYFSIN
jgi:hypothetical protein